jgi:hypothetical protein
MSEMMKLFCGLCVGTAVAWGVMYLLLRGRGC